MNLSPFFLKKTANRSALFGSELVGTVARTDGDGEAVATRTGSEVDNLLGLGVVRLSCTNLILNTGQNAQLSLNGHVVLVSIVNDLLGEGDILLVG